MTDPITDMLNHIRNAQAVGKTDILIRFSKVKFEIAQLLYKEGFLGEPRKVSKGKARYFKVTLKYDGGLPTIDGTKRISKPGQRIYVQHHEIKNVRGGYGRSIMSTPKGLMTGVEARKQHLGGEVLAEIW